MEQSLDKFGGPGGAARRFGSGFQPPSAADVAGTVLSLFNCGWDRKQRPELTLNALDRLAERFLGQPAPAGGQANFNSARQVLSQKHQRAAAGQRRRTLVVSRSPPTVEAVIHSLVAVNAGVFLAFKSRAHLIDGAGRY